MGPPGTGKTDVAVQIISNLYHNFPEQRTLIVTHSNQVNERDSFYSLFQFWNKWYGLHMVFWGLFFVVSVVCNEKFLALLCLSSTSQTPWVEQPIDVLLRLPHTGIPLSHHQTLQNDRCIISVDSMNFKLVCCFPVTAPYWAYCIMLL